MSTKAGPSKDDVIGRWSQEKLDLLENYLQAYARIMQSQKKKGWLKSFHYIDAFAGSSRPYAREIKAYIAGSPVRALRVAPSFDSYMFIELSDWRVKQLNNLRMEYQGRDISIRKEDCNDVLCKEVATRITRSSRQRGIVFLDPYGLQVAWSTLLALSETRALDVFINFPIMGIKRLLKRNSIPDDESLQHLERIIGNRDWALSLYKKDSQMRMFGDRPMVRAPLPAEELAGIYLNRLKSCFSFVSDFIIMANSKHSPLYALCLASHNQTAVKITNDLFKTLKRL